MKFLSQVESTVPTGTAPLSAQSTTVVTNLNADLLDGNHAAAFAVSGHVHAASAIVNTPAGNIVATEVQAAINELDTEKLPYPNTLTDEPTILDTDELVIQKTAGGVIKKVLWSVLKAASRVLGLTSGQIPYSDGTNLIGSANLTWNDTNKTLVVAGGVQTASLGTELLTNASFTSD